MEHVTLTQEILKWFAGACVIVMVAFIAYGWLKGLHFENELRTRRR